MSPDLLELTHNYFIGSTVRQISTAFGERESSVSTALQRVVPVALGALLARAQQPGGATDLFARVYRVHRRDPLANFGVLLEEVNDPAGAPPTSEGSLPGPSTGLLRTVLGKGYDATVARISRQAGVQLATVSKLLSLALPVGLGLLGRYAVQHTLDARGLASYLASQAAPIMGALDSLPEEEGQGVSNLTISSVATPVVLAGTTPSSPPLPHIAPLVVPPPPPAPQSAPTPVPPAPHPMPLALSPPATPRRWTWLLALLLVAILGIAATQLYLLRSPNTPPPPTAPAPASIEPTATKKPADRPEGAGYDHLAYIAGRATLPLAGRAELRVSNNSAEARLYRFLKDPTQTVSLDKTQGWLLLDQVYFNPGEVSLTRESVAQLHNLAAILKTFPHAAIKLGGYAADQGSVNKNLLISADCANAARRSLLSRGITPDRVAAEGFGQARTRTAPPASNPLSRRVYVRVSKKY